MTTIRDIIPQQKNDNLHLLAHIIQKNYSWVITHKNHTLSVKHLQQYYSHQKRLAKGEPLSSIINQAEFYGYPFFVNEHTLIPRTSTETIIDYLLHQSHPPKKNIKLLDLGTGSGCIAITTKIKKPGWVIVASDICPKALSVAKQNAKQYNTKVLFTLSDWLKNISGIFDYITCNPPYVLQQERTKNDNLHYEPDIALFPPNNSLIIYSHIAQAAAKHLKSQGKLIFEFGSNQEDTIIPMLKAHNYTAIKIIKDLSNTNRIVVADKPK